MIEGERIIAKVVIGEVEGELDGKVVTPFKRCTIITESGAMFDIRCLAFTALRENLIEVFEKDRDKFTRRENIS